MGWWTSGGGKYGGNVRPLASQVPDQQNLHHQQQGTLFLAQGLCPSMLAGLPKIPNKWPVGCRAGGIILDPFQANGYVWPLLTVTLTTPGGNFVSVESSLDENATQTSM